MKTIQHGQSRVQNNEGPNEKSTVRGPARRDRMCFVCGASHPKYTFICCTERFCSLRCYQQHMSTREEGGAGGSSSLQCPGLKTNTDKAECSQPKKTNKNCRLDGLDEDDESISESSDGADPSLTEEQMRRIETDAAIRAALTSAKLRRVIKEIDSAKDKLRVLSAYLSEPEFQQFSDSVMRAVQDNESNFEEKKPVSVCQKLATRLEEYCNFDDSP